MENASSLEILWLGIGLLALAAALANLADVLTDWVWVRGTAGVARAVRRVARTALLRGMSWLLVALLLVYVGGVAIILPPTPLPPVADPLAVLALRLSTIAALVLLEILVAGMIALEAWERRTWRRDQTPPPPEAPPC